MEDGNSVRLCSSELANLWSQYLNDSMSICFITHSLEHVKDKEVRDIPEFALSLSKRI